MLTYKEFRKKLLTELDQRGIKFEITSMTSVNGEKERISIAFSNFTTDNAVDSDHKPETFGLYPDHEYANYLGLCERESESPIERIVDDALQIMSQLSEKVSLEYVNSLLKLRDEDIIYQLINAKKNEELLKKVPHRIVADDLAVIYRIYKTEIDENSDEKLVTSTIILNSLMEESRYTEEKLYACASVNMPKQFPIFILNVQQSEIFSLLVNGFGYSLMDAKEKVLSMPLSTDIDFSYPARSINLKQKCKITLGTRLSFSDIGECAFRLQNCIFTNGGTILLPQEASRKKSNKLSPEGIVKDYNSQCYMKFDKIMEQLKSYETIPVTDMQQSVWNILEKLKFSSAFGFSNTRDLQKNYLSTFEKEGDALDVVIKILKIPGVLQRNYPGTTHDRVNECIGKIFNLKMEKLIV